MNLVYVQNDVLQHGNRRGEETPAPTAPLEPRKNGRIVIDKAIVERQQAGIVRQDASAANRREHLRQTHNAIVLGDVVQLAVEPRRRRVP